MNVKGSGSSALLYERGEGMAGHAVPEAVDVDEETVVLDVDTVVDVEVAEVVELESVPGRHCE